MKKVATGDTYKKHDKKLQVLSREGKDIYRVIIYNDVDYDIRSMHEIDIRQLTNDGWEEL